MRYLIPLVIALLAGCATAPQDPAVEAEARDPLLCKDKQQCDFYWQRAQAWIAQFSKYRIQTATDVVIVTHGPIRNDPNFGYQVTRLPNADGSARIIVNPVCGNMFGCENPNRFEAAIQFKRYVRGK